MGHTVEDMGELIEENARLKRKNQALRQAVAQERGATLAALGLGSVDLGPSFAARLAVEVEVDRVDIYTVDPAGKPRKIFDTNQHQFRALSHAETLAELREKFPRLPWASPEGEPTQTKPAKPATSDDFMVQLKAEAARLAKERDDANTAALARARQANPWAPATFNLTEQMRVARLDPKLAAELKSAAGAAA